MNTDEFGKFRLQTDQRVIQQSFTAVVIRRDVFLA